MKKIGIWIVCLLLLFPLSLKAVEQQSLNMDSEQMIVMSLNDDIVLYEKNTSEVIPLTALTRLMIVAVAIEHKSEYKMKDDLTFDDAIKAALESQEGALELVHSITSEATFINWMNEKVANQGLLKTHFVNVTGEEDALQKTTIQEFLQLLQQALKLEEFALLIRNQDNTFMKKADELNLDDRYLEGGVYLDGDSVSIHTYNGLSLLCLSLNARDDHSIINTFEAIQYYFKNYEYAKVVEKNEKIADIRIKWGTNQQQLTFIAQQDYYALLPINFNHDDLIKEVIGDTNLVAPVEQNQYVGEYMITYSNEVVLKIPLFSNLHIERNDFFYALDQCVTWILEHFIISIVSFLLLIMIGTVMIIKRGRSHN